jgi:hypothetical protein
MKKGGAFVGEDARNLADVIFDNQLIEVHHRIPGIGEADRTVGYRGQIVATRKVVGETAPILFVAKPLST